MKHIWELKNLANPKFSDLSKQSMMFGGQTIGLGESISTDSVTLKLDTTGDLQLITKTLGPNGLGKVLWHSQTAGREAVR